MPSVFTPFRYPGGKTKLYNYVLQLIKANGMVGGTYIEPFAGGAGLAIKLLISGIVKDIVLNDIDYAIYCVWKVIIDHTDILSEFIRNISLDISKWQSYRAIYCNQKDYSLLDVGLATFYLNRTNISGVLNGGVIGGLAQEGKYKIDARFNRADLINKIRSIADKKEHIHLYNWNAVDFILNILPNYGDCFVYFDPPYINKGPCLYKNSFSLEDHRDLSEVISICPNKWITTYDKCEFIEELYNGYNTEILSIYYSAGQTKSGDEIVIFGPGIQK